MSAAVAPAMARGLFSPWLAAGFGAELVLVEHQGKRPLLEGWQSLEVTPPLVGEWDRQRANVGLRTCHFPVLDVDVDDQELAEAVVALAFEHLGPSAMRTRANSPRCAVLYRLAGQPLEKVKVEFTRAGRAHKVEILGKGQQLVVAGLHPTGSLLYWTPGQPTVADLAPLDRAGRDSFLAALRSRLAALGCEVRGAPRPVPRPVPRQTPSSDEDRVRSALAALDPDSAHDEWVKFGQALHSEWPNDGGAGFALWDEWSARGTKYPGTEALAKRWRSFTAGGGVTLGTLIHAAKGAGWRDTRQETKQETRAGTSKGKPPVGLAFVRASDVQVEEVEWLWDGRLAAGKITVLEGDPGTGKTTLALSLAACMSNGTPFPSQGARTLTRRDVLVFSGEDGQGDTLKPRLLAAGADCRRVYFEDIGSPTALRLMLPRDIDLLEAKVNELGIGLVIIDPVMSYLDPDVDSHKDQEVRTALMPLAAMAQRTRVAIVLIRHLNKGTGLSALYRGGGSIAFAGVARLVLLAAKNPESPEDYVLARVKGNLGRPPPSLCYALGTAASGSSEVRWGGTSTLTPDELLAPPKPGPRPETTDHAKAFLRDFLGNGPKLRGDVMASADKFGLSERTVERAFKDLSIRSTPQGKERQWSLP